MPSRSDVARFWSVLGIVVVADLATKAIAVRALVPQRVPHLVAGDVLRLTLVYNPGAAFGIGLGPLSRWIFTALTLVALGILARMYRATAAGDRWRTLALALVCAGALGNLVDRLRSDLGVVDFIDIGIGTLRWPTFNIADMAVSGGAILLAWVLWREDAAAARSAPRGVPVRSPIDPGTLA